MSTRSCIARPVGDEFEGRYHHSDGYPAGLGVELWSKVQQYGVERARAFLIDEHTGWSTILYSDWGKPAGYIEDINERLAMSDQPSRPPICFCHGDRSEEGWMIHSRDEEDQALFIEWVYVLGALGMAIYSHRLKVGAPPVVKRKEANGRTWESPRYEWVYLDTFPWNGPEPDWGAIQQRGSELGEAAYAAGRG